MRKTHWNYMSSTINVIPGWQPPEETIWKLNIDAARNHFGGCFGTTWVMSVLWGLSSFLDAVRLRHWK